MFKRSLLLAVVALAFVTGSNAGTMGLTSVTIKDETYTGSGSAILLEIVFTPQTEIPSSGGTNTLTLTTPNNYFTGTPSFAAGQCSIAAATGSAGSGSASTVVLTIGGAAITVGQKTVTISGLKLGAAAGAGTFTLASGTDATASSTVTAPAILASIGVSSVTLDYNGAGSPIFPVITFTSAASITINSTITITMPAGYFLGTASFPAGNIASFTGAANSAANATSTSIVITTAGAASSTSQAIITLQGLTLGAAQAAGNLVFSSSVNTARMAVPVAAIVTAPVFTSISWTGNVANTAVDVTLTFTPGISVTTSDTITVAMPTSYFTGSGSFAAGKASVSGMTGSATTTGSSNTKLVITPSVAATGTSAFTCTLTGLSLGSAQPAGYFSLSTSVQAGTVAKVAPLIGTAVTSASITLATNVSGANVFPILAFTPTSSIPSGGSITIEMPSGYFLGTAHFLAGNSSVAALTGTASSAATSTSTSIVITTSGAPSTTSAFTVTLSGLTLGSARNAGTFVISTSEDKGWVSKSAPAIDNKPVTATTTPEKSTSAMLNMSVFVVLSLMIALTF